MKRVAMIRSGQIKETGREFDVEFWQRLGTEAILDAAWEMVLTAHRWKGHRSELRLQRVIKTRKMAWARETSSRIAPTR